MTKLLEEAVARVQTLPEEEQDRAAEALIVFATDNRSYTLTPEQVAGISHAMGQADRSEFASDAELLEIFHRAL